MVEAAVSHRQSRRIAVYLVVGITIGVCSLTLFFVDWRGSAELHTLLEAVAAVVAAMVGAMALVRYYSKKNNTILLVGAGFLGTAFLDAYHAIVTADFFLVAMPSDLSSLSAWSWFASRQLLALMLCLGWLAWIREKKLGPDGVIQGRTIYLVTGSLTIGCFLFFAFAPLPLGYYAGSFLHRPEEFVPALFFAAALIGYLRKGAWRDDDFELWLILSLIVSLVVQTVLMPYSAELFDVEFDTAHLLKIVSYLCVLVGLLVGMYQTFQQAEIDAIRFRTVFSSNIDGTITIEASGIVTDFNLAAEKIFGYSASEVIGRNVKMLMPEPQRSEHDQYLSNFLTTGNKKIIGIGREVAGRRKGGSTFPMDLGVTEAVIGGSPTFIGSIRDITELKETEREMVENSNQLRAANAELDAFAYSISHDLRAPLRAMGGFVEALAEDYGEQLDDEAHDYIQRIGNASRRMSRMIDDILSLSRTMRLEMEVVAVDFSAIVESILEEYRLAEPDRIVDLIVASDMTARADRRLVEIVLRNLVGNAWKFSANEARSVIEFGSLVTGNETVFYVRDNGVGFDMNYVEKLFGIFQRLHPRTEFEGNGIGLVTVERLISRHGGRIWAEGRVEEGATFYFTFGPQIGGWDA